jgi:hypothetical protein
MLVLLTLLLLVFFYELRTHLSDKTKAFLTFKTKDLVILRDFDGEENIRLSWVKDGIRYAKRFKYLKTIQVLKPDGVVSNTLITITWKFYK